MFTHQTINQIYFDNPLSLLLRCSLKFIAILCFLLFSPPTLLASSISSMAGQILPTTDFQIDDIKSVTNSSRNGREFHTMTLLNDGTILVVGGTTNSGISNDVRLYDSEDSRASQAEWDMLSPMSVKRSHHTATLLDDGSVLVVGGQSEDHQATNRVEIFDPVDGSWRDVASLSDARYAHTATRLNDGRVLVIGGVNASSKVEIYDPQNDQWITSADLNVGRYGHRDVMLPTGHVLALGGYGIATNNLEVLQSVEFYDVENDSWTEIADLLEPRTSHTATLLPNGLLIVVGGDRSATSETNMLSSVELLDTTQELQNATWQPGAHLAISIRGHTAIALPKSSKHSNGALLISGGLTSYGLMNDYSSAGVYLYDPDIGEAGYWHTKRALKVSRYNHVSTLLPNNQIFIFGGLEKDTEKRNKLVETEEVYDLSIDPNRGLWTPLGPLNMPRYYHTATPLKDGRILAVGGVKAGPTAELYDPEASPVGTWTLVGDMMSERYHHTATRLDDGRVVVIGGKDNHESNLSSVEVFDPDSDSWTLLPDLKRPRYRHTTALLNDNKLLVIGGRGGMSEVEIYDLNTARFNTGWIYGPTLNHPRDQHTATLLKDGKVLVVGGRMLDGTYLSQVEIYDPSHVSGGLWKEAAPLHQARGSHSATLLDNGQVLVLGGVGHNDETLRSVELYDPENDQWQLLTPMHSARDFPTASLLDDGTILVVGSVGATTSAEILDLENSEHGAWSLVAPLNLCYARHTATLLANGQILVLGSTHQTMVETLNHDKLSNAIIPTIQVTKRNDANRDGLFTVNEQAELEDKIHDNMIITFELVITNTAPIDVTIIELNDTLHGYEYEYEKANCSHLAGDLLKIGESVTCIFDTSFVGDDNLTLHSTTQVVVRSENDQIGVDRDETFIRTPDIIPSIQITQTNDADQDGNFAKLESAPSPSEQINFRLEIFNDGLEEVYIEGIPELNPNIPLGLSENCATLDRIPLPPGETVSCIYTQNISDQDNQRVTNVTTIQVKDNDENQSEVSTTSDIMIEDQFPKIELVNTNIPLKSLPLGQTATCNVFVENTNEYENLTLRVIQPEVQIVPPDGPPIIKADIETDCQGPRTIRANDIFTCNYNQKVQGLEGSQVNCVVSMIIADDDGNQISVEGVFDRYIIGDELPQRLVPDDGQADDGQADDDQAVIETAPTSLREMEEPFLGYLFYLPHVSR